MNLPRHVPHPTLALQYVVLHYPWSVLWLLFTAALTLVLTGSLVANAIVLAMILTISGQSIYRQHDENKGERPR